MFPATRQSLQHPSRTAHVTPPAIWRRHTNDTEFIQLCVQLRRHGQVTEGARGKVFSAPQGPLRQAHRGAYFTDGDSAQQERPPSHGPPGPLAEGILLKPAAPQGRSSHHWPTKKTIAPARFQLSRATMTARIWRLPPTTTARNCRILQIPKSHMQKPRNISTCSPQVPAAHPPRQEDDGKRQREIAWTHVDT